MDADEIQPLTRRTAKNLLKSFQDSGELPDETGKRIDPRWPFAAAVELWVTDENGEELHTLGACHNLSHTGIGVRCDCELSTGVSIPLAIHLPQASLHGKGVVRHCSERGNGYLVGIEFEFAE